MSGQQVLYQSPMMHRLLRESDGSLVLEVVVGGMAMYEVRVTLSDEEVRGWESEGKGYIDRLAAAIVADPPFGGRARRV